MNINRQPLPAQPCTLRQPRPAEVRVQDFGLRLKGGSGFRVQGLGFRV